MTRPSEESSPPTQGFIWLRSYDIALGLSAISWAVLGLLRVEDRPWSVRISLAALNLLAGGLFLFRREPLAQGSLGLMVAALPAMVLGAAAVRLADDALWPVGSQALFAVGALGACLSLSTLGRSFAFFPARRELVMGGPYRVVRHPAYLCELLMLSACAWVRPWPIVPLAVAATIALMARIAAEERVLSQDQDYADYQRRVRFRLMPGVW